jgi:hypothetical protein
MEGWKLSWMLVELLLMARFAQLGGCQRSLIDVESPNGGQYSVAIQRLDGERVLVREIVDDLEMCASSD